MTQNSLNNKSSIFNVDNLQLDGNTISSTSSNIILEPSGNQDVQVLKDTFGPRTLTVTNTDNTSSNSSAILEVNTAGLSGGSPFLRVVKTGSRSWALGMANVSNLDFRLSTGTINDVGPGTETNIWNITTSGEMTMPLQPTFLAFLGTTDNNVTGNGATYTLGTGNSLTKVFDQGGNFSTGGIFTAPVSGKYLLHFSIRLNETVNAGDIIIEIETSNRDYMYREAPISTKINFSVLLSTIADMDISDTATYTAVVTGLAGDTIDVIGSNLQTRVSGILLV